MSRLTEVDRSVRGDGERASAMEGRRTARAAAVAEGGCSVSPSLALNEKLQIAGYSAPCLRDSRSRPVKVVDAQGNILREVSSSEIAHGLHQRAGIEFDVQDGAKRLLATCASCKRDFTLPKRGGELGGGRMPENCPRCRAPSQSECAGFLGACPGHRKPSRDAFQPYRVAARGGDPWRCAACSARKRRSEQTAEERSVAARKGKASMSREAIRAALAKAHDAQTPAQRSERQRLARARLTPEQKAEAGRKAWVTRRSKANRKAPR